MATRVLIVVLFILSVLTSSALTYLMINRSGGVNSSANIGEEVASFIEKNPEVIIQGLRKAQAAREEKESEDSQKIAEKLRPQLENATGDAQGGNKDGDVTIVAFHDHNCGFCRKSVADVEKILSEDNKIKFVIKDFPILGPLSVEKAKASVAVAKIAPDKAYAFYDDLAHSNTQTVEQVIDLAQSKLGIDPNQLKSEMESKETSNKLAENRSLGEQLNINGTPVFIINGKVIRGALGYDAFKAAVAEARGNKSS